MYNPNSPTVSPGGSSVGSTGSPVYRRSPAKSNAGSVTSSPKKRVSPKKKKTKSKK